MCGCLLLVGLAALAQQVVEQVRAPLHAVRDILGSRGDARVGEELHDVAGLAHGQDVKQPQDLCGKPAALLRLVPQQAPFEFRIQIAAVAPDGQ